MTYEEFKELQDIIGKPNLQLAGGLEARPEPERKPIDRVNDTALILWMVFAFDAFCSGYVQRTTKREGGALRCRLLQRLKKKAQAQGKLPEIEAELKKVDRVIMIRHLWAHGAGRRSGLQNPDWLPPDVLEAHHFETDGDRADPNAQWWPTRFDSFSACVAPINKLAEMIRDHITP